MRQTGTPIKAVSTPTGSCCGAITVRAKVSATTSRLPPASADAGKKVFAKCASCHNADKGGKNATGPNLWGVVERPVASHEGFNYSPAMVEHAKTNPKWTLDDLDHYLTNPAGFVPKNKMGFAGLKKPEERANVIEYLRQQADSPVAVQ